MKKTEPLQIGELFKNFLRDNRQLAKGVNEATAMNLWSRVVGKNISESTSQLYMRNGVLYVSFSSSTARSEVFMNRTHIINNINAIAGKKIVINIVVK